MNDYDVDVDAKEDVHEGLGIDNNDNGNYDNNHIKNNVVTSATKLRQWGQKV